MENSTPYDLSDLFDHEKLFFETIYRILTDKNYTKLINIITDITKLVSDSNAVVRTANVDTCRHYGITLFYLARFTNCPLKNPDSVSEDIIAFPDTYTDIEGIQEFAEEILGFNWEKCAIMLAFGEDALRYYEKLKLQYIVHRSIASKNLHAIIMSATQELRDMASNLRRMAKSAHYYIKDCDDARKSYVIQYNKLIEKSKFPKNKVTKEQLVDMYLLRLIAERNKMYAELREETFNSLRYYLLEMYHGVCDFADLLNIF
jgi:hypothetical protein